MTDLEKCITERIRDTYEYQMNEPRGGISCEYGKYDIDCDYSIKVDGYTECGYFNGTGAFVETDYDFRIDSCTVYDDEDNEISVNTAAIEEELNKR